MTIKVLLVDDSIVALTILKRILTASPEISIVGTARTGVEALELVPKLNPDIICTDLHMPKMNGLELTMEVMERYPRPILVISASVQDDDPQNIFKIMEAGAVDVFPKPRKGLEKDYETIKQPLINKVKVLSGIKVFTRRRKPGTPTYPGRIPPAKPTATPTVPLPSPTVIPGKVKMVIVGASTGGPQALQQIFAPLPIDFPVPIVCVQHISDGFLQGLVDWLNGVTRLSVQVAQPGFLPLPGHIYFPPERQHLEFNMSGRFVCSNAPPVSGHRPSVSATFNSAAHCFGKEVIAILLTGMGRDGADGMLSLYQNGALTIAQDEATSVVFGMPKEAIALGAAKYILPVAAITPTLQKLISQN